MEIVMSNTNNTNTEDAAKASFPMNRKSIQEVIVQTNHLTGIIKQHPQYGSKPAMQQSVTDIDTLTQTLAKQEADLKSARVNITSIVSARGITMHAYGRARRTLLAVADQIASGSASTLNEWGFGATIGGAPQLPPSTDPPVNLRVRFTKSFEMVIAWKAVTGHRGYLLQIGDGTPAGWGTPIQCPKGRYTPSGLNPGQKIAIRVAVQRKSGLSAWSEAISATVR
jgi:hypothetical protein